MKKILLGLVAVVVVVGGVAAMSAYEAHVINVTAHIENALSVPTDEILFGTVFPQEYVESEVFTVGMSQSFLGENDVTGIDYVIKQKTKCVCESGAVCDTPYAAVNYWDDACPEDYVAMPTLCPFLSKTALDNDGDISHPSYFQNGSCLQPVHVTSAGLKYGPTGWGGWSCPANTTVIDGSLVVSGGDLAATYAWKPGATTGSVNYPNTPFGYTYTPPEEGFIGQNDNDSGETIYLDFDCMPIVPNASGELVKVTDETDSWVVDLKVPPIAGYVGQEWPAGCPVLEQSPDGLDYGCDLWIEVTGIDRGI